ncbi:MAG: ABC transporter ATP-binding protein [Beijerinckiaceae bacterium]|nr:ABC transporter ATP-binding protein [Beijerinckiaceae bacterium]
MTQAFDQHPVAASLDIQGVRLAFGGTLAVDDVSLSVQPGQTVCLLGHSGCGKTTLLRIVAGLERPTGGRVLLDGREVTGPGGFVPPEQRGVGLMFQDYALFPHLTILENVMFGLGRLPGAKARAVAEGALARVGLAKYAGDYPHMLSGGEQQRVALARALAPQPGVLLMDEPFSNLDQRMRERIREETMGLLREKGATALVVTHDPVEAMMIADRIALMRGGRIVQTGAPEELYERPASLFVARFFCDLNEFEAPAVGGRIETPLGVFPAPDGIDDGPCVVCLRPASVKVVADGAGAASGVVISLRFLGESDLVTVAVDGLPEPLLIRAPARTGPKPGERVGLEALHSHALVFSRRCV